jgi:glycopeptide antibiotics resistance protein
MRRALVAAYAIYLAAAAYLVFWPQPDTPAGAVRDVLSALESAGITFVSGLMIEFALNLVLFVPMTLLGVLIWPRTNPLQWLVTGLAATFLIEFVQYAALPDRSATLVDIVANSLGALIGMDLGLRLLWLVRNRRQSGRGQHDAAHPSAARARPGR